MVKYCGKPRKLQAEFLGSLLFVQDGKFAQRSQCQKTGADFRMCEGVQNVAKTN
jgi:hypothetical protein